LQAAREEVQSRLLDEAVAAGEITQEEAELMQARQALGDYLRERMQVAYEDAVAQAVADGTITQEQADQLLSEQGQRFFGPAVGRPHGRHSAGDRAGGMFGRPDRSEVPNSSPLQPENGTQEESGAPVVPLPSSNL
jgi:polyhydroxyalkanoate synthesis regulator phasin